MTDPRVQIIRFWFWGIAACLFALWNPEFACGLAWLPLALNMPVIVEATTVTCTNCTGGTAPATFQLDIGGFGSDGCDCSGCNDSWVVEFESQAGNVCQWCSELFDFDCDPPCDALTETRACFRVTKFGAVYAIEGTCGGTLFLTVIGAGTIDCDSFTSEPIDYNSDLPCDFPITTNVCDGSGASMAVTSL